MTDKCTLYFMIFTSNFISPYISQKSSPSYCNICLKCLPTDGLSTWRSSRLGALKNIHVSTFIHEHYNIYACIPVYTHVLVYVA